MQTFDNNSELLKNIDQRLRAAYENGMPYQHEFRTQRARLDIESLDEPVQFDFYTEYLPGSLLVPRLGGRLAVAAILPQDEDRDLFRPYAVVDKKGHLYGVPTGLAFVAATATHLGLSYAETSPWPDAGIDDFSHRRCEQA